MNHIDAIRTNGTAASYWKLLSADDGLKRVYSNEVDAWRWYRYYAGSSTLILALFRPDGSLASSNRPRCDVMKWVSSMPLTAVAGKLERDGLGS